MTFSEYITESNNANESFIDKLLKKFEKELTKTAEGLNPSVKIIRKSIGSGTIFNFKIDIDVRIKPHPEIWDKIKSDAEASPARRGGSFGSASGIVGRILENAIKQAFLNVAGVRIAWIDISTGPTGVSGYLASGPVTNDGFTIERNKLVRR